MIKQFVVFGDYAVDAVSDGNFKELEQIIDDTPNSIGYREFNSEEERMAYLCGLSDAAGWMESWPLSDNEVKKLGKRMDLSCVDNLESGF